LHDARSERVGLVFAALCVANGAFVPAVAKLTTEGASALFVAAASAACAGLAAAAVLAARGELGRLFAPAQGPRLALVGLLGTALAYALFFEGARRTTAIDAVLCLQAEPVYALLVARLFLGHRLTARRVCAVAAIVGGIALAVAQGALADPLGVAFLLAAPLCWQLSHLVVLRGLAGVSPPVLTGARYVYGGLLLALYWALRGAETGTAGAPGELWARLPLLAVQGTVLAYVGTLLWYQAIARLDLARTTAIVVPSIPLVSIGASFALLGEAPTLRQWLGLLLAAAGVLAFVLAPRAALARALPTNADRAGAAARPRRAAP
jgi:drug/metabolite transporter (DMT)-like permease